MNAALVSVYLTVFIDILGFGIILPSLPYYAREFGATGVWIGVLMTAYSAAQFFSASVLGRLSDRYGRRPILLMSLAGSGLSLTLSAFAPNLATLIIARALAGAFGGSISAAQAYVADVTKVEERAKYMGLLGASIGLGFVFGPALGSWLSAYGFGAAALVAALLAFVNLAVAFARLPETSRTARSDEARKFSFAAFAKSVHQPGIAPLLAVGFLVTFGFVAMETTFALLGADLFGMDARGLGLVFTYMGVIIVIVQGGVIGRLAKRFGDQSMAACGAGLMALAFVGLGLASSFSLLMVALGLLACGNGFANPTLASLLSKRAPERVRGGVLGTSQSLAALARAVSPVCAGFLYDVQKPAPYYLAAGLAALGATLLIVMPRASHP